jgi:hypothetical protein
MPGVIAQDSSVKVWATSSMRFRLKSHVRARPTPSITNTGNIDPERIRSQLSRPVTAASHRRRLDRGSVSHGAPHRNTTWSPHRRGNRQLAEFQVLADAGDPRPAASRRSLIRPDRAWRYFNAEGCLRFGAHAYRTDGQISQVLGRVPRRLLGGAHGGALDSSEPVGVKRPGQDEEAAPQDPGSLGRQCARWCTRWRSHRRKHPGRDPVQRPQQRGERPRPRRKKARRGARDVLGE